MESGTSRTSKAETMTETIRKLPRNSPFRRRSFTLAELMVSVVVMGVIMTGLGSAIMLATRAIPDGISPLERSVQGAEVLQQLGAELQFATAFAEMGNSAVQFTVADRDSDDTPEIIRYEWSGTPGDPLTRQYNGGTMIDVAEDVQEFLLAYDVQTTLTGIRISLQVGSDPNARVETSTQILNAPEVAGP